MEAEDEQERDWAQLPIEILELISSRVCLPNHHVFGLVCHSWRRSTMAKTHLQPRFPWLMLPKDRTRRTRGFYCLHHHKLYQIPIPRVVRQSWSCGSSCGWFIMSHRTRGDFLFNPFSGSRISLPTHQMFGGFSQRSEFYQYYITKAILSCEPTSESIASRTCVVAAIFANYIIAFCRPGDPEWTCTDFEEFEDDGEDGDGNDHDPDGDGDGDDVEPNGVEGQMEEEEEEEVNGDSGEGENYAIDHDLNINGDHDHEDKDNINDGVDDNDESEHDVFIGDKTIFELVGDEMEKEEQLVIEKEGEDKEEDDLNNEEEEEEEEEEQEDNNYYDGYHDDEEEEVIRDESIYICDVIFHKGKLYAITGNTQVYVCEIGDGDITWTILQTQPLKLKRRERGGRKFNYLVESQSELLMVVRVLYELETKEFIVFRLDQASEIPKWVRVESLGDQVALFVGQNESKSVKVADFPGLERNCIYYTDDYILHLAGQPLFQFQYRDSGVFSLDQCKLKKFLPRNYQSFMHGYAHSFRYPPLWITPNPL